ncbi:hypothetical protein LNP00_01575 [Fructobacillus sp. M158]|uniref:hypothetical protein n=1 Tax=Fructobacillus parabroussonetiae TaxID=2713174 RepID=UPI00200B65D4|nr:hypothetical protein [Fructobacillus parabroussonetiae]MCK8617060.1 hypothetical protein [Fructobacillus parabroussonetiae]
MLGTNGNDKADNHQENAYTNPKASRCFGCVGFMLKGKQAKKVLGIVLTAE